MFSKLSQIDDFISNKDVYALGLRLNALSSLYRALRSEEAADALTEALDKVLESSVLDSVNKNELKRFMSGTAMYTAFDFTGDEKYRNAAIELQKASRILKEMIMVTLRMQMIRSVFARRTSMKHFIWHMKLRMVEKSSTMML